MEKRVLLAVVLSFLVLYGFQTMFPPPEPPKPGAAQGQAPKTAQPSAASPAAATPAGDPPAAAGPEPPAPAAALVADAEEREIVVESHAVHATFSTRGGVLKSWRLKKYLDASGQPLELVPQDVPATTPRPFTLTVDDAAVSATLARALFKPSAPSVTVSGALEALAFDYSDASGITVHKKFAFDPQSPYVVYVSASVTKGGSPLVPSVQWGPALETGLDAKSAGYYNQPPRALVHRAGEEERFDASEIGEIANAQGQYDFIGVDDHYFLVTAVGLKEPAQLHYELVQLPLREGSDKPPPPYISWALKLSGPPTSVAYFMGPKDYDILRAIGPELTRAIDFGMFGWLVVPLLRSLKWVNTYIHNYGWSIVALTVLINLSMFPLRHKSVVSMRRMQAIQPEIKAIQDRYAKLKLTDPARQKMNSDMMALYKERGVNPASGCVPMLLTLPVLFAFYAMLSVAIELRGAPFFGWITDLSRHDPLYITPVLMGATQFIQTKMTPSTADPTQQRIMLLMPLMFMGMFLWAPSGLVIYWTVSNIWAIGQQTITNKLIGPQQERTVRPPAERRVKSVGTGRSEQASKERQ
jgi:YidC/Oxa1 family membrane protein insertase